LMIAASPRARRGTRYYSGRIRAFAFSSPGPVPVSRRSPNLRRSEAVAYYGVSLSELHGSMVAHWDSSMETVVMLHCVPTVHWELGAV
jgi:hypothetical protein